MAEDDDELSFLPENCCPWSVDEKDEDGDGEDEDKDELLPVNPSLGIHLTNCSSVMRMSPSALTENKRFEKHFKRLGKVVERERERERNQREREKIQKKGKIRKS